jgi:hypothetical protein
MTDTVTRREFVGATSLAALGQATPMTLVPLYQLFDERYVIYWNVNR